MKIEVEATWNGQIDGLGFRLTTPLGEREYIKGAKWTRKLATEALDLYEQVYGYQRSSIRFLVY